MRVLLQSQYGVTAELEIDANGTTRITTGDGSQELDVVVSLANGQAMGPFPDLAALEVVQRWADETDVLLGVVGAVPIPEIPEDAVF